ncbi:hypothetical protein D1BOALGB6SA_1134, partial [Olavius sp. associated proteobacterium Delta 1]
MKKSRLRKKLMLAFILVAVVFLVSLGIRLYNQYRFHLE